MPAAEPTSSPSAAGLLRMPQVKIQDGVGLLDADFNGSFVLQCISCQHKRLLALGPHSISFPHCTLCGYGDCLLRQRVGVVFVNVIDRGSVIILTPFGHRSSLPSHTADCLPFSSCVHRMQSSMIKQNIRMEGKGAIATGAAVALLDANGAMCAFGDVGQEYNNLPLAVTNVEGTEDMASADRYGWILPFALTKTGEHSRATAARAARECLNIAIDESDMQPFALWETAWPAHPNKGACTTHELFVVWACERSERSHKINVMVHGDQQYSWIPAKRGLLESTDRRKGCVSHLLRPQSEFCKFVVECFKHGHSKAQDSYTTPIKKSHLVESRSAVVRQWSALKAASAAASALAVGESDGSDSSVSAGGDEAESAEGVGERHGGGFEDDESAHSAENGGVDDDWEAEQDEMEGEEEEEEEGARH